MSVRQGFLALLSERPMHGYQLRQEFEARTGGTWPLNIGQAYTTLQRLERDGLVEPVPDDDDAAPERFRLTEAGSAEADAWWLRPVERKAPARDELAIKLALAVSVHPADRDIDVAAVIQHQRTETLRALRDYTRLKHDAVTGAGPGSASTSAALDAGGLAWSLVLDSLIFATEAEARWLDHVESTVARAATQRPAATSVEHAVTPADAAGTTAPGTASPETATRAGAGTRRGAAR